MLLVIGTLMTHETKAQYALISPTYGNPLDTVTNTGSKVLWKKITGDKTTVTVTVNITSISGTLGGTVIPIVSNDGVNFYNGTANTISDSAYTVTNTASQGKAYTMKRGFQYYGVQWTGTGTMVGSFSGTIVARKPNE